MDALWYGIANIMEWFFGIVAPIGMMVDWLFIISIAIGVVYWLWYDMHERKGGRNYMADKGGE